MKNTIKVGSKKLLIPKGKFADGDWFECLSCGAVVRKLVYGNTATCSDCGGKMVRK